MRIASLTGVNFEDCQGTQKHETYTAFNNRTPMHSSPSTVRNTEIRPSREKLTEGFR